MTNNIDYDLDRHVGKFYGKYRGIVSANDDFVIDGERRGRIQVQVPSIFPPPANVILKASTVKPLPTVATGDPVALATPKVWADSTMEYGTYNIPPVGAGVWIEFEAGDTNYPLWSGVWYTPKSGKMPIGITNPNPAQMIVSTNGTTTAIDGDGSLLVNCSQDIMVVSPSSFTLMVGGTTGSVSVIANSDGSLVVTDGNGSTITFDGLGTVSLLSEDGTGVQVSDGNVQIATLTGISVVVDDISQSVTLNGQNIVLNSGNLSLGVSGFHPVTVSDLLYIYFEALVAIFNAHVHTGGTLAGGLTGTPTTIQSPPDVVDISAETLQVE